jgi:hypothetical protein
MAWEGPLAEQPDLRVRVEASAYRGRPVSFSIVGPWTRAWRMGPEQISDIDRIVSVVLIVIFLLLMAAAMLLARHNFRTGRADRRGALRLAIYIAACGFAVWLVGGHHGGSLEGEVETLLNAAAIYVMVAAAMGVIYLALEPYVRRFWPDSLLGWSRLLAGHVRDPRVGRDVLTGAVCGVSLGLVALGRSLFTPIFGYPAVAPNYGGAVNVVTRAGKLMAAMIGGTVGALEGALLIVLIFVVLRLLLRRPWLSMGAGVVLMSMA